MANFVNNFIPGGCLALILCSKQSMMHFQKTSVSWLSASHHSSAQQAKSIADVALPI